VEEEPGEELPVEKEVGKLEVVPLTVGEKE